LVGGGVICDPEDGTQGLVHARPQHQH
jgi:hypothetical protein